MREPFDPKQLVKQEGPPRPETIAVLKMNQILNVPTGLYVYQQMHSNFWRVDNAQLLKFSAHEQRQLRQHLQGGAPHWRSVHLRLPNILGWHGERQLKNLAVPANGYFYDELPWLVRTIDFTQAEHAPSRFSSPVPTINSKKDTFAFQPAKISFTATERAIDVAVQHAAGTDHFMLDRDGPHLLREWKAADGSHLKMKRNLKVDYWNYNKPGDRERALNNPMLRLPD